MLAVLVVNVFLCVYTVELIFVVFRFVSLIGASSSLNFFTTLFFILISIQQFRLFRVFVERGIHTYRKTSKPKPPRLIRVSPTRFFRRLANIRRV